MKSDLPIGACGFHWKEYHQGYRTMVCARPIGHEGPHSDPEDGATTADDVMVQS